MIVSKRKRSESRPGHNQWLKKVWTRTRQMRVIPPPSCPLMHENARASCLLWLSTKRKERGHLRWDKCSCVIWTFHCYSFLFVNPSGIRCQIKFPRESPPRLVANSRENSHQWTSYCSSLSSTWILYSFLYSGDLFSLTRNHSSFCSGLLRRAT